MYLIGVTGASGSGKPRWPTVCWSISAIEPF